MADLPANIFTAPQGGMDAGLLALANQNKGDNALGGIMPIAGLALLMRTMFPNVDPALAAKALDANDVQNIVAANAAAQTANTNATMLLKDIQDSSQEVISAVNAASAAQQLATLNAEIANLQGQGQITTAIADSKYAVTNEVHEVGDNIVNNANAAAATNLAAMNLLASSLSQGHAEINSNIAAAKYDTTIAVMNDGDKTRAALAVLAANIPNARELDLQRQLAVALEDHRHTQTRGIIDSGNVSVVTNVNQAQNQSQMQQQLITQGNLLSQLAAHQVATANNMNILGVQRGINQTPVNVGN